MQNTNAPETKTLEELLQRLAEAGKGQRKVTLRKMLEVSGRRGFGPALLIPGLILLSPISGIPGMPSTMAAVVLLVASQLLIGRERFWLPAFLMDRGPSPTRLEQALRFLRPIARFVDRYTRPRLLAFTGGIASRLIATFCLLIAVTIPPLEILPFAASSAGAAFTAFGLALVVRDGLLALMALLLCIVSMALIGVALA